MGEFPHKVLIFDLVVVLLFNVFEVLLEEGVLLFISFF